MYAVLGGIAALFLGYAGVLGLKAVAPDNVPRMAEAPVDPAVLLFALLPIRCGRRAEAWCSRGAGCWKVSSSCNSQ
jgi:hypothetical protein